MMEFSSLAAFGEHLIGLAVRGEIVEHEVLEVVCQEIELRAKDKIGEYQQSSGPFAAWQPLAEMTVEDRVAKGYSPDEPLLRTGEMAQSIEHKVIGNTGHIGSDSDIALWQELGTDKIPARSFLGGAAFELEPTIREEIGVTYFAYLSGGHTGIKAR